MLNDNNNNNNNTDDNHYFFHHDYANYYDHLSIYSVLFALLDGHKEKSSGEGNMSATMVRHRPPIRKNSGEEPERTDIQNSGKQKKSDCLLIDQFM